MTITYRNTFRDRVAFVAYGLPRKPVIVLMVLGLVALVTFGTVIPTMREVTAGRPWLVKVIAFIFMECITLGIFFAFFATMLLLALVSKKNKPFYCERSLTVGADGIVTESEYGRSETRWKTVQKLGYTRHHLYLYVNADSAMIVPRRVFADEGAWNAFYKICRKGTGR